MLQGSRRPRRLPHQILALWFVADKSRKVLESTIEEGDFISCCAFLWSEDRRGTLASGQGGQHIGEGRNAAGDGRQA
jgi:hypothetical protein